MADDLTKDDLTETDNDYIKNKLFQKRIVLIDGDFTDKSASDWIGRIVLLDLQASEVKKPIILFINSYGGDCYPALGMIHIIKNCKNPVYTVCIGTAQSQAAIILAVGKKRFAVPGSRIMIHGPTDTIEGEKYRTTDAVVNANEMVALKEIDKVFWSEITGLTPLKLNTLLEKDNYLSAEKALELKIIDKICWDIHKWVR